MASHLMPIKRKIAPVAMDRLLGCEIRENSLLIFVRFANLLMNDLKDRILSNVEERLSPYPNLIEPCWIWKKAAFTTGYGVLQWEGRAQRIHRLSYRVFKGPIPEGMDVLHACDIQN